MKWLLAGIMELIRNKGKDGVLGTVVLKTVTGTMSIYQRFALWLSYVSCPLGMWLKDTFPRGQYIGVIRNT